MSMIYPLNVNAPAKDITIRMRVTGVKRFTFRIGLALQVLRFASLILPTKSEIKVEMEDDAKPNRVARHRA